MYIGVFNAKNSEWWNGNSTNLQGTELAELEAQYSLNQVIYGPTHILPNSARFIDLIFTKEKNFVSDTGALPSLFPRWHHQLIFAKVSFTTLFHPANVNAIRQHVNCVDWDKAFEGLNIYETVKFLSEFFAIKEAKSNYFSRLGGSSDDPAIIPKNYWSILHSFLYKHKIPKIHPISHNNTFLTDIVVKTNTFNSFVQSNVP